MTVLDTNIVIYFLEGRLQEPLPGGRLAISVISEIELLSTPGCPILIERCLGNF